MWRFDIKWKLIIVSAIYSVVLSAAPISDGRGDQEPEIPVALIVSSIIVSCLLFSLLIRGIYYIIFSVVIPSIRSVQLSNENPGEYDDALAIQEEDNRALMELSPNDQEIYFQAKDFMTINPISTEPLSSQQLLLIEERGISSWEFKPDSAVKEEISVSGKTDIQFKHSSPGLELSAQSNLPIPQGHDVYYFETKIMECPEDTQDIVISVGLATEPYPYFRLPGRHRYSISYESNGDRRYNQPFHLKAGAGLSAFPKFGFADVVGVGYRTRTGTIFFTRNGKKVSESKIGGHIQNFKHLKIYPTIGATNHCNLSINLGQRGFVFIEANVKKWGFAPLEGSGPPPPAYKTFNEDVLLESSSEYSDGEDSFPPDFWNATRLSFTDVDDENITLNTLPLDPPLYRSDSDIGSDSADSGTSLGHMEPLEADEPYEDADDEDNLEDYSEIVPNAAD